MVHQDIRIVIVHSHRLFRETLAMTLSLQEGIAVSSEVSGLDQIRADGVECQPDLFLVEASAPLCRCLDQVRCLQTIVPDCKTIILGVPDTDGTILACIEVGGASGYVLDNGSFSDVVRNIRAVVAGESVCSPRVANLVFSRISALAQKANLSKVNQWQHLTRREEDIVESIERGLKSPNIDHMRGQLVEELHAVDVRKALSNPKDKAELLGKSTAKNVEFIGGYRIQRNDAAKSQITDGIVGVLDHEKHVVKIEAISEAKAGQGAAEGLTTRRTPLGKRADPITGRTPIEELRKMAADDLADINLDRAKKGLAPLDVTLDDWVKELQKDYVQGERGGQPRSVLERLREGEGDEKLAAIPGELLIDGVPFRVEMSGPRFLLATPSGVDVKAVPAALKAENITASLLPVNLSEGQVTGMFGPLTVVVDAAEKAAKIP
jgi:DNA-binding NarL/FixJ family response regulator